GVYREGGFPPGAPGGRRFSPNKHWSPLTSRTDYRLSRNCFCFSKFHGRLRRSTKKYARSILGGVNGKWVATAHVVLSVRCASNGSRGRDERLCATGWRRHPHGYPRLA